MHAALRLLLLAWMQSAHLQPLPGDALLVLALLIVLACCGVCFLLLVSRKVLHRDKVLL
jgi:hypothetical protein